MGVPKVFTPRPIKNYMAPPLDLLTSTTEKPTIGDLRANANVIKRTLDGFGIPVEMGEINVGPAVTRYTLKPAEGVKLSRITALSQDLALSLAAHPIRIEAPIPGKSLVGIEVPNKAAALVRLGSLMNYPEFMQSGPLLPVKTAERRFYIVLDDFVFACRYPVFIYESRAQENHVPGLVVFVHE